MQDERVIAAINVLAHLVLTKPRVVQKFLANNGRYLEVEATDQELIHEVIELIWENQPEVMEDLTSLFASHITFKGHELIALGESLSDTEEDQFITAAIGAAAGLIGGIGSWVNGSKNRKAQEEAHRRNIAAQAAQTRAELTKVDTLAKVEEMRLKSQQLIALQQQQAQEQARLDRQAEEKKEKREKEEKDAKSKKTMQTYMGIGLLAVVAIFGVLFLTKKKGPASPYPHPYPVPSPQMQ